MASPNVPNNEKLMICIDRGGTFTDCIGFRGTPGQPGYEEFVVKLLSEDPSNYKDAPTEGIRRIIEMATKQKQPRDKPVPTSLLGSVRMGTTVATNALLERKGEKCALLITKGYKDLLTIGNQSRPKIFDLSVTKPDVLHQHVVEVDERVILLNSANSSEPVNPLDLSKEDPTTIVQGISGDWIKIQDKPDFDKVKKQLQEIYNDGYKSIAVCLMHSYTFPDHEKEIGDVAKSIGFEHISLSHQVMPMVKIVPRGTSADADAYLTPCIQKYIQGFTSGFDDGFEKGTTQLQFMQSDGGLVPVSHFSGFRAILSGPAGGVVGYALTSFESELDRTPVIGFDMGGTSTDVSRYDGYYEHVFESTTAGVTIQAPQLDINTVAAGGGSMLFFENGMFVVGPQSAGAHPGPACYRKGGPLAVSDANLFLGRLLPDYFPKIFGPDENEALDCDVVREKFTQLAEEINKSTGESKSLDEIVYGFIKVANETMCRPIRALTEAKGHDTSNHVLAVFGGAGGQHACGIARNLGIGKIVLYRHSSILSAFGLALADVVHEVQEPCAEILCESSLPLLKKRVTKLIESCTNELQQQGFKKHLLITEVYLNLRYDGTDCALMTLQPNNGDNWDFGSAFTRLYKQEFGFSLPDRSIVVDDIRVRGIGKTMNYQDLTPGKEIINSQQNIHLVEPEKEQSSTTSVYFEATGRLNNVPVYLLSKLSPGSKVEGPAMIIDATATVVVEPSCSALITSQHITITVGKGEKKKVTTKLEPIQLSIFSHRFMSIAEQMGRTLQKTSISTNIKERLDFSCALFGADGGLVANAPHIPVHLGALSHAVTYQMNYYKDDLHEGDVIMTNHPAAGGSHLPDITIITPVFHQKKIVFFVASRGHHADIGGISPGSMPPHSKELYQEGAAIKSFKIVSGGRFDGEGVKKHLYDIPGSYPGCSGTRLLQDNISDLKAQIAANQKGITLVERLIDEYSLEVVQAYMLHIRRNAESAVRNLLKQVAKEHRGTVLQGQDMMDDGTVIKLSVHINEDDGSAVFDFDGTGPEVYGNTNTPESVCHSAIIYCIRCLVDQNIPLNSGCLEPIDIRIPPSSILSPSESCAVVGGNVLTSQRICDVVLKTFNACAASQGCCNNLTFGKGGKNEDTGELLPGWGYYETIAGGSGAGPDWHGQSGVHTHMTNTRITDPEILEKRYPVVLREFSIRKDSGGQGAFKGGDGVIRDIEFLESGIQVSILSERRVFQPYGLAGGENAQTGMNLWIRKNGANTPTILNLSGKNSAPFKKGDRIVIHTPGGGGYGSFKQEHVVTPRHIDPIIKASGSLGAYKDMSESA
ncbi:Hydantoinase B/oxoprolinase-domain-containing protein [Chlamydoabsidia padenii]|nr:Hydantoinase B/oxoprolinase-domain-containing protein [Chlamydoabsidia padenii]